MAFPFIPSKRSYERNTFEPGGRTKLQKSASAMNCQSQLKVSPGAITLRVLCPASRSGSVIGKGGGIVERIRQETGAKIRLEETVPGCDERVVVITVIEKDTEAASQQSKEDNEDAGAADEGGTKGSTENEEGTEDSAAIEGSKLEIAKSSALKALLLVFERIIEGEAESDDGDEEHKKEYTVSIRLLVLPGQVGCLLGKGGSVVKQMSADSGANIRILPRDKLPLCASPQDEIVMIAGETESVRKALQSVVQQLLDNPPRERDSFPTTSSAGPSSHPFMPRPEGLPPANFNLPVQEPPFLRRPYEIADYHPRIGPPFPQFFEGGPPGQTPVTSEIITFRLLCSNDKVGSVIGKGGSIVKAIQNETGCEIKVLETTPESEDRIIIISGPVLPTDQIAPAQEAVLRVQHRIVMAAPDTKESVSKLLVASNQAGCLLGKGGSIIAEMRKLSGAHIRILAKDQIPKGVPENDEVVQVTGEFEAIQDAMLQITSRLKHHIFRDKLPNMNPNSHPAFVDQLPPYGSFMGRRELSPPRFSNIPPFHKDTVGRPYEERSSFPHAFYGPGVPHGMERSGLWPPQGMRDVGFLPDYPGRASQRRVGGFAGASQPHVITHTCVDVVVPRSLVPSIYGENGHFLRRIREISEAKITITEPRPEATETVIKISGTPEQTNAAQSLLQAFVLSESGGQ